MTAPCQQLYQDINHESWHEYDLETLPGKELVFLCKLFACAHSGTKQKVALRLMMIRRARIDLDKFTDDPAELAAAFSRSRLRQICESANLWKSGNKLALSACILMWRNRCRLEGQKFLMECQEWSKANGRPKQLSFWL
jgi:hypothetical protein